MLLLNNGQVKSEEAEPVVIGGMVLDIHATPSIPANPRTTTPGKVSLIFFPTNFSYEVFLLGELELYVQNCHCTLLCLVS